MALNARMKKTALALVAALAFGFAPQAHAANGPVKESYGGRDLYVYVPAHLPPPGKRALVVVLHGGMGSAERIVTEKSESGLNMDRQADRDGFIVAYLNGTKVARFLRAKRKGWNAGGGCCGLPYKNNVNDVAYIEGAVDRLESEYGIDKHRVFGMGHSNGAMMTQRLMCETHLYAAGAAVSGPLNLPVDTCPDAKGARILAIHGEDDRNVPIAGGKGTKGISRVTFSSEARTKEVYAASGASYTLDIVPNADHKMEHIDAAVEKTEGQTVPQKIARFFGLDSSH